MGELDELFDLKLSEGERDLTRRGVILLALKALYDEYRYERKKEREED